MKAVAGASSPKNKNIYFFTLIYMTKFSDGLSWPKISFEMFALNI